MTTVEADWKRTSPVAVVFFIGGMGRRLLTDGLPAVAPLLALAAAGGERQRELAVIAAAVLALAALVGSILSWWRFRFRLRDGQVQIRQGVIQRQQLTVVFSRIQNVTVKEPFYMRPFGLAVLALDTAGSRHEEAALGGIDRALALSLRRDILAERQTEALPVADARSGESGDEGASGDESLILTRSPGEIARYGLTVNYLLWFAVAVGALFSFPNWEQYAERWVSVLPLDRLLAALILSGGFWLAALAVAVIGLAMALLLPLLSMLGGLLRYYGYRLVREGHTYRRTAGLLNRHDESIKRHRIQAVTWLQNAVARRLGRINLQARVASPGKGQSAGGPSLARARSVFVVPVLRADEAARVTEEFLPGCETAELRYSPIDVRRYAVRSVLVGWTLPLVGLTLIPSLLASLWFLLLLVPGFGVAWWVTSRVGRRFGYAVRGEYGMVRSGFIGSRQVLFPLFKVQRIDLRQSPGQRRRGLATLIIHLASHSLTVPYLSWSDAVRFGDLALFHAETAQRRWY